MIYLAALAAAVAAFFLAWLSTPVAGRIAVATGFIDVPKQSRHHRKPTPLLGGSAMLVAILMPSLLALALASIWQGDVPGCRRGWRFTSAVRWRRPRPHWASWPGRWRCTWWG